MPNSNPLPSYLEQDKKTLEDILSQQEYTAYQYPDKNVLRDWIEKLYEKLREWFPDMPPLTRSTENVLFYVLAAVALGIIIYFIYWFIKQYMHQKRLKRDLSMFYDGTEQSYSYYLQKARECHSTKEFELGIRYGFIAILRYLDYRKWMRVEKWKTNWEYLQELKNAKPDWIPFFRESAILFERVYYGKKKVEEQELNQFIQQIEGKWMEEGHDAKNE